MSSVAWFFFGAAVGFFAAAICGASGRPTIAPPELHGELSTAEVR